MSSLQRDIDIAALQIPSSSTDGCDGPYASLDMGPWNLDQEKPRCKSENPMANQPQSMETAMESSQAMVNRNGKANIVAPIGVSIEANKGESMIGDSNGTQVFVEQNGEVDHDPPKVAKIQNPLVGKNPQSGFEPFSYNANYDLYEY